METDILQASAFVVNGEIWMFYVQQRRRYFIVFGLPNPSSKVLIQVLFSRYFYYLPYIILRKWFCLFDEKKTRYFSTCSMLCDCYSGFPPLHRKANKVLQGGVSLPFIYIAPCLTPLPLFRDVTRKQPKTFAKQDHYTILEFNSNMVTWWLQNTKACCMWVMQQNNGGALF